MKIKYVPFIIQETRICKSLNLQQKTSKRTLAVINPPPPPPPAITDYEK